MPESPDTLTPQLLIDDKPLKDIITRLYYPDSPYEFSALPADVLGQVYEQFLGKVISLTPTHQVKVEEKPEVRKAGGVYYTPTFVVDYIVRHTLGKLLEGKKPGARGSASKIKIVDPACGSGSFLIVAYQYLLDWHRDRYVEDGPQKHSKELYQGLGGQWLLTTQEKKRILLNNIYGVDIDPQAVEVTKLSLLLKVLEGESSQSLNSQLRLFHERALPDLDRNIKCGNSLIDSNFYNAPTLPLFDEDTQYRINAFDWSKAFPEAFSGDDPGFDAVIGNPPYIRIQALKEWVPLEVEYYKKAYKAAAKGNYDIYVVFVEKGLSLLNRHGQLGFILPHKFFNAQYGEPLRLLLSRNHYLSEVINFGDEQVFEQASTYTCLMFLDKAGSKQCHVVKVDDLVAWRNTRKAVEGVVPAEAITEHEWNFVVGGGTDLFERLSQMPVKLESVTSRIFQGIKTSADKIYIVEERVREANRVKVYSKEKDAEYWLEPYLLHPLIKGGDSRRYSLTRTNRLILFPYAPQGNGVNALLPEKTLQADYPLTWAYLKDNKKYLEDREDGKMRGSHWYGYIYPKALDVMPLPKIFTPDIAAHASYSLDETGELFFTGGVAGGYGILVSPAYSREYILGLLNSKLLEWFIRQSASQMRGGYYSFESRFIRNIPIRTINFSNPSEKARHDGIVALVEQMLSLLKRLTEARMPQEKNMLQQQIARTDRQIDELVYELYGLTEEEINMVEGKPQG